ALIVLKLLGHARRSAIGIIGCGHTLGQVANGKVSGSLRAEKRRVIGVLLERVARAARPVPVDGRRSSLLAAESAQQIVVIAQRPAARPIGLHNGENLAVGIVGIGKRALIVVDQREQAALIIVSQVGIDRGNGLPTLRVIVI